MTVQCNGFPNCIRWLLLVRRADESAEEEPVMTMIRTIQRTLKNVGSYGTYERYKNELKMVMSGVDATVDDNDDLFFNVRTSGAKQLENVTLLVNGVMISLLLNQTNISKTQWVLRRLIEINDDTTGVALLVNHSFDVNNVSVECITA